MHAQRLAPHELEVARCRPLDQRDQHERDRHHEHDHPPGNLRDAQYDRDDDQERHLAGYPPDGGRDPFARATHAVSVGGGGRPRLLRPSARAQHAQIGAERGGLAVERVDGLQRAQRRVQLGGVPVEGVERGLDALLLVALLGDGQVLDPRQPLARGVLRSGPGLLLH